MTQALPQELLEMIHGSESITVEFKKLRTEVTKDVYEIICAFSNRINIRKCTPAENPSLSKEMCSALQSRCLKWRPPRWDLVYLVHWMNQ